METVFVIAKGKRLRVISKDGRFVRFPRALREPGAVFHVEKLVPLQGGKSWNASGEIRRAG